jgi:hypothetical protein
VKFKSSYFCTRTKKLSFGDWTRQGLPFYGGNVTYHCKVPASGAQALQFSQAKASLIKVTCQGQETVTYLSPYIAKVNLPAGVDVDITVYGHRGNAFGCVHMCDPTLNWFGPHAWRTSGKDYCPEYQLHSLGLITSPMLLD